MRVVFAVLALAGAVAQADDPRAGARAEFAAGTAAYEQGRYSEAAQHFLDGYSLTPLPALLFNAAQALRRGYEQSGDRALAARSAGLYRRYLDCPDVPEADRKEASQQLTVLEPAQPAPRRKRTGLWIGIGVGTAVVVGLSVGLAVGFTRPTSDGPPSVIARW